MVSTSLNDSLKELITNYHELNSSEADEFDEEPSPLEFMRYVSRNRPFVVRKGANDWVARRKWNASYLRNIMSGQNVNVAITPKGNADSPTELDDGSLVFVKPYETEEPFSKVLSCIQDQELSSHLLPSSSSSSISEKSQPLTRYAQTQNDNLRNEYETLFSDVPPSVPFARIALQQEPDAINFWLGNSHSTTALHKDNYENIYVQILGKKHFVLLPPVEAACVNERKLRAATYQPVDESSLREGSGDELILEVRLDESGEDVPFATWNPDAPSERATMFSELSRPTRVTLEEGDMLYLPALWYHKVSQSCSSEGICVAVNYWYDMEFGGPLWSLGSFSRSIGLLATTGGA